ncbi:CpaF family protein [Methanobacterium formicicum]|uniref:Type ii secretion system protein E n=1 Tax=Methanobacterium formicicum (strain DSM 3637 / PP1) TaxID=1204725 RepID=K2QZV1_METFP|nr:CpaF family protein [Methanobacterium formicicum]EKF85808.1 type ii secretion system protein E [Methanobacterium formicicum DSM 3637]
MKDKRKEILKDLLGEFGSDDDHDDDLAEEDEYPLPREKKVASVVEKAPEEEEEFTLDKIMKKTPKRKKKVRKSSDGLKAEIIEEGLIPKYNVSVPHFSDKEELIFNEVREKLVEVAVAQGEEFNIDEESFIGEVKQFLRTRGVRDVERLATQISQVMLGYGKLDPMIKDDDLEEIMVIGTGSKVFVYHRKIGMMVTNVVFESDDDIRAIIDVIARQVNRRIDQQTPILDARLKDGSRVNATLPPVSADGPTLTIRKFRKDPLTVVDLINFKTMSSHLAGFLWLCTDGMGVKPCNAIIAGGTGSGKTTTLNTIAAFVPPRERIITIEDTLELQLPHSHVLRMETRPPNIEGKGELTMDTLVKNSLRQRPDRVIVGEVRGSEAITLFTALNTGHSGMGTLHSNTARETITRLINSPMSVPNIMIPALDFIIMQNRMYRAEGGSLRRVTEVAEVVGMEEGNVQLNRVFEWNNVTDKVEYVGIASQTLREMAEMRGVSITEIEEEIEKRRLVLEYLADNNIRSIEEVGRCVNSYYKDPDEMMDRIL